MVNKRRPKVGRKFFTPDNKCNAQFEAYYRGQGIVTDEEWPQFMAALQKDLPITFRVTGFREQNRELLRLIKLQYRDEILRLKFPPTDTTEGTEDKTVSFNSLPWYPDELAWQLDTDRYAVRRTPELKMLHQFLVSETESGNISRQEAVSMLPPLVMDIQSHHAVLDLCAAPGSKSAQLVEMLHASAEEMVKAKKTTTAVDESCANDNVPATYTEPTGMVMANDVDQKRCYMMIHQVKRLQSPCTMITQEDATCFPRLYTHVESTSPPQLEQFLFDRVLTDVPCSGDGTLRKNPDLWLRWSVNLGIAEHHLQVRILRRGLEMLRDRTGPEGSPGRLVYSTCSFNPLENEAVVAHLLHAAQGALRLVEPERLNDVICRREIGIVDSVVEAKENGILRRQRFITRPGLSNWRVMDKKGNWYQTFEEVPSSLHSNIRPSLFPPSNVSELQLDRCLRVFPQDQNTGGFFLAVLEKVAPLPWMRSNGPYVVRCPTINPAPLSEAKTEQPTILTPDATVVKPDLGCEKQETKDSVDTLKRPLDAEKSLEGTKQPRIYQESPITYMIPTSDTAWPAICDYYNLSCSKRSDESNETVTSGSMLINPSNLLYRSNAEDAVRRRQFYYTNELVKRIVQGNCSKGVKIVHTGVRIFSLMDDKQFTGYRLLQDGVELADAFLPRLPLPNRRVCLEAAEYGDLVLLLQEEMPLLSRMSARTQAQCDALAPGPVLIEYRPVASTDTENALPQESLPQCRLVFVGWRGIKSLRHYVGRHERLHMMRLARLNPDPVIAGHTLAIFGDGETKNKTEIELLVPGEEEPTTLLEEKPRVPVEGESLVSD